LLGNSKSRIEKTISKTKNMKAKKIYISKSLIFPMNTPTKKRQGRGRGF